MKRDRKDKHLPMVRDNVSNTARTSQKVPTSTRGQAASMMLAKQGLRRPAGGATGVKPKRGRET